MKRNLIVILFLTAFLSLPLNAEMVQHASVEAPLATQLTLRECYQLALKRSEAIAINAQLIKEAEGHFYQSLSTFVPQVSFVDTEQWQDGSGNSSSRRYEPERKFVFTQPLFSGFKEFAGMAASRAERQQRRLELIRAKQILFIDVSDAFYFLKTYEEDLNALEQIDQSFIDRIEELKKRQSLGRSRPSDTASTEVKLYQNQATIEALRSEYKIIHELMEFLVGQKISSLAHDDLIIERLLTQEEYMAKANERADVLAALQAEKVARQQIAIARSGYWPKVNVMANSYVKRTGEEKDNQWDVLLEVDVPIFDGTKTFGDVKVAQARAEAAKYNLSLIKRRAVLEIQNTYTQLISSQRQAQAYLKAFTAAERNYNYQLGDYRNSLVNNLEVLQSLEDLQISRRSYITLKNNTQRFFWNLKVATADVTTFEDDGL